MGLFGGGDPKEEKAAPTGEMLNTEDLRSGARSFFDVQNDCSRITRWYGGIAGVAGEDSQWHRTLRSAVDYAGTKDDKVTKEDFAAIHKNIDSWLERKQTSLDNRLPFIGQFAFGCTLGFTGARLMKMAYRHKFKFVAAGMMLYNVNELIGTPTTPEQLVAKQQYETLLSAKDTWLQQYNLTTPGRVDMAVVLDKAGLGVLNKKLGPGGLSEGPSGTASKSLVDSTLKAKMSREEFAAWFSSAKTRQVVPTHLTTTPLTPTTVPPTATAAAAPPAAPAAADPAAPALPEARRNVRNVRVLINISRIVTIAWSMIKCLFLAFLLAYDKDGPTLSFFAAALILFAIHMIQASDILHNIVVVRPPRPAPAAEPATPVAEEGAVENNARADAREGDAAGAAGVGGGGAGAGAGGAEVAGAVGGGAAPAAGGVAAVVAVPVRRSYPRLLLTMVVVFVESLIPSWTLRELERHQ